MMSVYGDAICGDVVGLGVDGYMGMMFVYRYDLDACVDDACGYAVENRILKMYKAYCSCTSNVCYDSKVLKPSL